VSAGGLAGSEAAGGLVGTVVAGGLVGAVVAGGLVGFTVAVGAGGFKVADTLGRFSSGVGVEDGVEVSPSVLAAWLVSSAGAGSTFAVGEGL